MAAAIKNFYHFFNIFFSKIVTILLDPFLSISLATFIFFEILELFLKKFMLWAISLEIIYFFLSKYLEKVFSKLF